MHALLAAFPELPLLILVLLASVLFRAVRRCVVVALLALVLVVVLGSFAHCALAAGLYGCGLTG